MGNGVKVEPVTTITGESGKVYRRSDTISFARYRMMERFNVELSYGRTVHEMFQSQKEAYELLDKLKLAEAAVKIHYSMMGIARIADGRTHPAVSMCMLFWNTEGEPAKITPEELEQKVADVSHLDMAFFFGQAVSSVPGLLAAYRELTPTSSEEKEPSENGSHQKEKSLDQGE